MLYNLTGFSFFQKLFNIPSIWKYHIFFVYLSFICIFGSLPPLNYCQIMLPRMRRESRYLLDILISFPVGFGSVVGWLGLTMAPVFLSWGTFVLFHSDCTGVSASLSCALFLSVLLAAAVLIHVRWELLWFRYFPWLVASRIFCYLLFTFGKM